MYVFLKWKKPYDQNWMLYASHLSTGSLFQYTSVKEKIFKLMLAAAAVDDDDDDTLYLVHELVKG